MPEETNEKNIGSEILNNAAADEQVSVPQLGYAPVSKGRKTWDTSHKMPPVRPSSVMLAVLFGLLVLVAFVFYPYIALYLPFGGQQRNGANIVVEKNENQLMAEAKYIVIAKVAGKEENIIDKNRRFDDGLGFLIYAKVKLEVQQVLYGNPEMDKSNPILYTYELGGSYVDNTGGKPTKYDVVYPNAANLENGSTVLLFLDDQLNLLGERYGVYLRVTDDAYQTPSGAYRKLNELREIIGQRIANESAPQP